LRGCPEARDIADEGNEVPGNYGGAAQFPGPGSDDDPFLVRILADHCRVAAAVHRNDAADNRVFVAGAVLGARA
jgi:hypothetical protein